MRKKKYNLDKNHRKPKSDGRKTTYTGFRCPEKLRADFQKLCAIQDSNMSRELRSFMRQKLEVAS